MEYYLLINYKPSNLEILQSLFISEYGLRHLNLAEIRPQHKWRHWVIAIIEICPWFGLIPTMIEAFVAKWMRSSPFVNRTWVFVGSQNGHEGDVAISKVEAIRAKLQNQSPLGIHFNRDKVVNHLEGGTCTAMCLEFIDSYFKIKKNHVQSPESLINRIAEVRAQFASSSEKMRIQQAAYNTIEVVKADGQIDYSKNKLQALANDYNLTLDYSSKEIDVEEIGAETELESEIDILPKGLYFVRILKPANNEKLEEKGHSLVYIKEPDINLFYDPSFGLKNLAALKHSAELFQRFKYNFEIFQVSKARFYQVVSG
jgi:hypothetical protein